MKKTLAFFKKIISRFSFGEFLMFDGWNCLGETRNIVYRRQLLVSSSYRIKKWNVKCILRLPTAPSSGPFKIDNGVIEIGSNHFVSPTQFQSSKNKNRIIKFLWYLEKRRKNLVMM